MPAVVQIQNRKVIHRRLAEEEVVSPMIRELNGKMPVAIYGGNMEIDLDLIAEMIEEYPDE